MGSPSPDSAAQLLICTSWTPTPIVIIGWLVERCLVSRRAGFGSVEKRCEPPTAVVVPAGLQASAIKQGIHSFKRGLTLSSGAPSL
jgi:hypothetical protein